MAGTSTDHAEDLEDDRSLKNTFDIGMKIFEKVDTGDEPTNSPSMQLSVKQAIDKFESATRQVSLLGLFSKNESVEELPTESLQYLLLPALLGSLSLKICDRPRKEVIALAEVYFRDYLQRCKDYGITDVELPPIPEECSSQSIQPRNQTEQQKLTAMVLGRDAKIRRYKEQKALKDKLLELKKALNSEIIDDQTKREYFTTLLLNYVNVSLDELSSIQQEKPILEYMESHAREEKPKAPPRKPLNPIIITRDAIQKAVYGLGYPSIPSLTIEEFYNQRAKDGTFPAPGSGSNIAHRTIHTTDEPCDEDPEAVAREKLREEDDPNELRRQREMDEYKDEHKRGEGNRYNRS